MIKIIDSQSTGKTKKLLAFAKENNCIVICLMPSRMKDKAMRYGLGTVDCISYDEFLAQYKQSNLFGNYVIDEPEKLLTLMFAEDAYLCGYDMTIDIL